MSRSKLVFVALHTGVELYKASRDPEPAFAFLYTNMEELTKLDWAFHFRVAYQVFFVLMNFEVPTNVAFFDYLGLRYKKSSPVKNELVPMDFTEYFAPLSLKSVPPSYVFDYDSFMKEEAERKRLEELKKQQEEDN